MFKIFMRPKALLFVFTFYLLLQRAPNLTDAVVAPPTSPTSGLESGGAETLKVPEMNAKPTDVLKPAMESAAEVTQIMNDMPTDEQMETAATEQQSLAMMKVCRKDMECHKTDWWKHMVIYQIYPRSFMDSNGDGVGDLQGIISRLSYVADMGIKAIWLSPICKSPMSDFGYDISDFKEIHAEYGTMEDFDMMMAEAKRLGLKVIMDFVPNHTSNQSTWFQNSINRVADYEDFYIWADAKTNKDGEKMPPNNWRSVFRGSAWTYNEKRGQYYLHQFTPDQPDLNYRNPKVIAAMDEVMRFWLDKGIHSFRIDAINHLFEDEQLRDEPLNCVIKDENNYDYTVHIYTKDQPEVLDMLQHWRQVLDDYTAKHGGDVRIIMTEAYTDVKILMDYYETKDGKKGAHFPFNFNFITNLDMNSDARDYVFNIQKWLTYMPRGHVANWVMGNHDNSRMATRFGPKRVDALHMLMMTLPGVVVTYNGEEIGMQDHTDISWEQTVDPLGINAGPELYKKMSRDAVRTPFHWNTQKNAGFSTADKTWLPMHPNYSHLNLKRQMSEKSHYSVYKELVALRTRPALRKGRLHAEVLNRDVFAFEREMKDDNSILTVINIGPRARAVNLTEAFHFNKQQKLTVLVSGVKSTHEVGLQLNFRAQLILNSYEGIVFDLTAAGLESDSIANRRNVIKLVIKSVSIILVAILVHQTSTRKWTQLRCWNRLDRQNNENRFRRYK